MPGPISSYSALPGDRTFAEPLVAILHAGYAFIPFGLLLAAVHAAGPDSVPLTAPVHAWTTGMVGVMTLAVMTRASLGHTGHALTATPAITLIYACALTAAATRIFAAMGEAHALTLWIAAVGWLAAFGGFVVVFGPLLIAKRRA